MRAWWLQLGMQKEMAEKAISRNEELESVVREFQQRTEVRAPIPGHACM